MGLSMIELLRQFYRDTKQWKHHSVIETIDSVTLQFFLTEEHPDTVYVQLHRAAGRPKVDLEAPVARAIQNLGLEKELFSKSEIVALVMT